MFDSIRKAKLRWRCRRGMLELDLMLQRFIESYLSQLNEVELVDFESLLSYPDPDLFSWLMGSASPENKELDHLVELIQLHSGVQ